MASTMLATCAKCQGPRNCEVLGHSRNKLSAPATQENWFLLSCRGCDYLFFQIEWTDFKDISESKVVGQGVKTWPEPQPEPKLPRKTMPSYLNGVSGVMSNTYELDRYLKELYIAINADLDVLALLCVRTCMSITAELVGAAPECCLDDKTRHLTSMGFMTEEERQFFQSMCKIGHASDDPRKAGQPDDVIKVTEALEQVIHRSLVRPLEGFRSKERISLMRARETQLKELRNTGVWEPVRPWAKSVSSYYHAISCSILDWESAAGVEMRQARG